MALLQLSEVEPHEESKRMVRILDYRQSEEGDFVVYNVQVTVGPYSWCVRRRYSEFAALDKARFANYAQKSFLPPKKVGVLKNPAFLEQRRSELESYLRTVVELDLWLGRKKCLGALPEPLASFLKLPEYEVHGMVELLAGQMAAKGEEWLATSHGRTDPARRKAFFQMHTYELNALTQRLALPEPTAPSGDRRVDLGHLLDFLHRLPHLKLRGGSEDLPLSNIPINGLSFSLRPFKSLHTLWVTDCKPDMIREIGNVRQTVKFLSVLYTLNCLSEFLVDPEVMGVGVEEAGPGEEAGRAESSSAESWESGSSREAQGPRESRASSSSSLDDAELLERGAWPQTLEADFSFNQLRQLHSSVTLLPRLQRLNLSNNRLDDIGFHLQHLTQLRHLDLSNNGLEKLELWHARLGNLESLVLAGNSIRCVRGLSKLFSLQALDLSDNSVVGAAEGDVWSLGRLGCLERLWLKGNPLENGVDYRSRVLEVFGERAGEVELDGAAPSVRELDTVRVRLALRRAKEERERQMEASRQHIGAKLRSLAERTLGRLSPETPPPPPNSCDCCKDQPHSQPHSPDQPHQPSPGTL